MGYRILSISHFLNGPVFLPEQRNLKQES